MPSTDSLIYRSVPHNEWAEWHETLNHIRSLTACEAAPDVEIEPPPFPSLWNRFVTWFFKIGV